jgi:hypothetical protein
MKRASCVHAVRVLVRMPECMLCACCARAVCVLCARDLVDHPGEEVQSFDPRGGMGRHRPVSLIFFVGQGCWGPGPQVVLLPREYHCPVGPAEAVSYMRACAYDANWDCMSFIHSFSHYASDVRNGHALCV